MSTPPAGCRHPFPISSPFFATDLPAALPTTAEIENSQHILKATTHSKVVAVGQHFVVKYGVGLNLEEGRMMIFIQQRTRIPVPRVFALYHETEGKSFIVMERIHGQPLTELWNLYTETEKENLVAQLKGLLEQLRQIESPGGYCSLDQQPLYDPIFRTPLHNCDGPFDSEMSLNNALIKKCYSSGSEGVRYKAKFYQRHLHTFFRDHPPVLTHGDIQMKNIMIRPGPKPELVLLDWATAGWYPKYWEYTSALWCAWFQEDWSEWLPKFLEPFPKEYAWFEMLTQELAF